MLAFVREHVCHTLSTITFIMKSISLSNTKGHSKNLTQKLPFKAEGGLLLLPKEKEVIIETKHVY